jgi:hypothetical protein
MRFGLLAALVLAFPSSSRAEESCRPADREHALKVESVSERSIALVARIRLEARESLADLKGLVNDVRTGAPLLRCDEPALSPKEKAAAQLLEARWLKWSADEDKALAAEEAFRTATVLPLCEAIWGAQNAEAVIAHERANPSGVVDLRALHEAGESLQYYREQIAGYKPVFRAGRKREFTKWEDEACCVAEANAAADP